MSETICAFCTLPATHMATVSGKHYPRLCRKHWREVMFPVKEEEPSDTGTAEPDSN